MAAASMDPLLRALNSRNSACKMRGVSPASSLMPSSTVGIQDEFCSHDSSLLMSRDVFKILYKVPPLDSSPVGSGSSGTIPIIVKLFPEPVCTQALKFHKLLLSIRNHVLWVLLAPLSTLASLPGHTRIRWHQSLPELAQQPPSRKPRTRPLVRQVDWCCLEGGQRRALHGQRLLPRSRARGRKCCDKWSACAQLFSTGTTTFGVTVQVPRDGWRQEVRHPNALQVGTYHRHSFGLCRSPLTCSSTWLLSTTETANGFPASRALFVGGLTLDQ